MFNISSYFTDWGSAIVSAFYCKSNRPKPSSQSTTTVASRALDNLSNPSRTASEDTRVEDSKKIDSTSKVKQESSIESTPSALPPPTTSCDQKQKGTIKKDAIAAAINPFEVLDPYFSFFCGNSLPFKLQELSFLTSHHIVEICLLQILVSYHKERPFIPTQYEALQEIIGLIAKIGQRAALQDLQALNNIFLKKLNLGANPLAQNVIKFTLALGNFLKSPMEKHGQGHLNNNQKVISFISNLQTEIFELIFPLCQILGEKQDQWLGEIPFPQKNKESKHINEKIRQITVTAKPFIFCAVRMGHDFVKRFRKVPIAKITERSDMAKRFYKAIEFRAQNFRPTIASLNNIFAIDTGVYRTPQASEYVDSYLREIDKLFYEENDKLISKLAEFTEEQWEVFHKKKSKDELLVDLTLIFNFYVDKCLIEFKKSHSALDVKFKKHCTEELQKLEKDLNEIAGSKGQTFVIALFALFKNYESSVISMFQRELKKVMEKAIGPGTPISPILQSSIMDLLGTFLKALKHQIPACSNEPFGTCLIKRLKSVNTPANRDRLALSKMAMLAPSNSEIQTFLELFEPALQRVDSFENCIKILCNSLAAALEHCQKVQNSQPPAFFEGDWMGELDRQDFEIHVKEVEAKIVSTAKKRPKKAASKPVESIPAAVASKGELKLYSSEHSERLLTLFRHTISGAYGIPLGTVPTALCRVKNSLEKPAVSPISITMNQQLMAIEGFQTILEMKRHFKEDSFAPFFEDCLSFYEHLGLEQGLQIPFAELFPTKAKTHELAEMEESLKSGIDATVLARGFKGTSRVRYPDSFAALIKLLKKRDAIANFATLEDRVKAYVGAQIKAFEKCTAASKGNFPTLNMLWKKSAKQTGPRNLTVPLKLSDSQLFQIKAELTTLSNTLNSLLKLSEKMPLNTVNERKASEFLLSTKNHLYKLICIAKIMTERLHVDYLGVLGQIGQLSIQYLAENLGFYLAMQQGKDVRSHNLFEIYMMTGLGQNLTIEEWEMLKQRNLGKHVEYPHEFCADRSSSLIPQEIANLSAFYGLSGDARRNLEFESETKQYMANSEILKIFFKQQLGHFQLAHRLLSTHLQLK